MVQLKVRIVKQRNGVLINFNSSMVQLKELAAYMANTGKAHFNSSMVQLKAINKLRETHYYLISIPL